MGGSNIRIYTAAIATPHTSDGQKWSAGRKREIAVLGSVPDALEGIQDVRGRLSKNVVRILTI